MKLRPYQHTGARRAYKKHLKKIPVCVVSPTGSGKTPMMAEIALRAFLDKKRVLIVCYRREAVFHTTEHLVAFGVLPEDIGFVLSGYSYTPDRRVQVGTWSTLCRRALPPADTVIFDEAHHAVSDSYVHLADFYGRENLVGFSATPYRRDNRGLGDVFSALLVVAQPQPLIRKKWLADPRIFTVQEDFLPDLRSIRRAGSGDYLPGDLEREVDQEDLIGKIVSHWHQHAEGRQTLVFGVSVAHSQHLKEKFVNRGVRAAHLDSKTPLGERQELLDKFSKGEVSVLCNCMILSESFDLPRCQAVVLARPTHSYALAMQQMGRAMRYYSAQRPVILDHAQNCVTFGLPQSNRNHQLSRTHVVIASATPTKICPECGCVCVAGLKVCPECAFRFRMDERIWVPAETTQRLKEISKETIIGVRSSVENYATKNGKDAQWTTRVLRSLSLDVQA